MEGVAPPLKCLIEVQYAVQNGESVRTGLTRYVRLTPARENFCAAVRSLLFAWDQGHDWRNIIAEIESPYRRALLELAVSGLEGQPISPFLDELRIEIDKACDHEIKHHLEMLPLRMLIPLLLFQFPAFLLLMFGPILNSLIQELNK